MNPEDPTQDPAGFEDRSTQDMAARTPRDVPAVGPYRLLQRLGEGGMGEVWLAEQTEPVRRTVAIKFIKAGMDSKPVIARFEAERQALAMMDHPVVARVFDAGVTPAGAPYFVMEYVRGVPITVYCDHHRLGPRARLELFRQVCEGVQHAHQKAIVHRDLKPSNILVTEHDGKPLPKIIDFGLAKAMAQKLTDKTLFTELGVLIGTPEYMSPEQANLTGEDVDTRTDVYSLGVILYQLLVGALPFDSQALRSAGFDGVRRIIREEEPKRPSTRVGTLGERASDSAHARGLEPRHLRRQLEGDLDWITLKALEKDRARRYDSPAELARDIDRYLADEPVLAGPPSASYRARKFVRRHRGAVLAAGLVAVALVAGIVGTTAGLLRARRAEAEARAQYRASERVSKFLAQVLQGIDPQRLGRDLQSDLERRIAEAGSLGKVNFVDVSSGLIDRQIFTPAGAMIDTAFRDQPEVAARLHATLGESYMEGLQLFPPAVAALRQSVAESGRARRAGQAMDWDPEMTLALALKRMGGRAAFAEAESLYGVVLADARKRGTANAPVALVAATKLGDTYRVLGQGARAESTLRDAVARMRRATDLDPLERDYAINDLALALRGEAATRGESDSLFREAIAGLESRLGPGHYEVLSARLNRARLLMQMERFPEAEAELRRILEAGRPTIGAESDLPIQAQVALGDALKGQARNAEAVAIYREAERVMRKPGNSSRSLGASILNRSGALDALGQAALAVRELTAFGEEQRRTGTELGMLRYVLAQEFLARLHARHGERAAALECLRRMADAGYDDPDELVGDSELQPLHGPDFDAIVARVRRNAAGG